MFSRCEDHRTPSNPRLKVRYWVRPDLEIMTSEAQNNYDSFKTLDGNASWFVNENSDMIITLVQVRYKKPNSNYEIM